MTRDLSIDMQNTAQLSDIWAEALHQAHECDYALEKLWNEITMKNPSKFVRIYFIRTISLIDTSVIKNDQSILLCNLNVQCSFRTK